MRIAVASVVYKNALEYLDDFLNSISEQTTSWDFTILLLNDDIPDELLEGVLGKHRLEMKQEILLINSDKNSSISQLRVQLIREAKIRKYDFLIFSDCDDKLSSNRVEHYLDAFDSKYSFYYNDLRDFSGHAVMPELPAETLSWKQIEEENYLGLGNSGIYLKDFSLEFIESLNKGDTKIFDWYLFSRILLAGMKGKKVENCCTYYRIHERNIAGKSVWGDEQLKKEIAVKIEHYRLLEDENPYFGDLRNIYETYYAKPENLVLENEGGFWWGLIKRKRQ